MSALTNLNAWTRRTFKTSMFAVLLTLALLVMTAFLNPWVLAPASWAILLGTFAPFAIAAMASTPAIVSGGGGIDISIGPLMALIVIVFVKVLQPAGFGGPLIAVPLMIAMGGLVGLFNGFVIARFRYPPVIAYALGGVFAGIGSIALLALLQSADATQGGQYTLLAIAAVALGGTSLIGGRGSLRGGLFGAASIFLLQDVLTALDVPSTWLRSAYGAALLAGVIVGARALIRPRRENEAA